MLTLPEKGFRRSVGEHNIETELCADWLEAGALFTDADVSTGDVVDILLEADLYASQEFAWEFVDNVFSAISLRGYLMEDNYPFTIKHGSRLLRKDHWKTYSPYSFCLALSLTQLYPQWADSFGKSRARQGELFEILTAESLRAHYQGWTVKNTGWTRTAPKKIQKIVAEVSAWLGEGTGAISMWTRPLANEAGLDLVCFRQYKDFRGGFPTLLVQCASGKDWKEKLKTPDLRIWEKIVTFSNGPKKALSMPFAISDKDFVYHCNVVDGLLLDRYRLLAPGPTEKVWVTVSTSDDINEWLTPRILALPVSDSAVTI